VIAAELAVLAPEEFAAGVADWMVARLQERLAAGGTCSLALSGGHTPQPVYEALASPHRAAAVDWERVEIYFGDERGVPADAAGSNYRMAREALLDHVALAPARVHRMAADRADLDAACREYEALLPPRLDVLLLGMGPDGHTASLFPGSDALGERWRRVVPATAPVPPTRRMTVTPPVIAAARHVAVVVAGAAKAGIVARALAGPAAPREFPVQLAAAGHWFLDAPAAAGLGAIGRSA
jgi:6-phosphogluconolactonase